MAIVLQKDMEKVRAPHWYTIFYIHVLYKIAFILRFFPFFQWYKSSCVGLVKSF